LEKPNPYQLNGKKILLVFQPSIKHSARVRQEIDILQSAGAEIDLVSIRPNERLNLNGAIYQVNSFEPQEEASRQIASSNHPFKPIRVLSNVIRNMLRKVLSWSPITVAKSSLYYFLLEHVSQYDILWVYDVYGLPSTVQAVKRLRGARPRIVYETQDLVPEYFFAGKKSQRRKVDEKKTISYVDAMITAGKAYEEYYSGRYSNVPAISKIFVWPNFTQPIAGFSPNVSRPRKLIFYGGLSFNRPIRELIFALAEVKQDFICHFVGQNLSPNLFEEAVLEAGMRDKIQYIGHIDPEGGVEFVSEYDLGIVALSGSDENERRAPASKVGTYLAAGLGIIASDLPGIRSMLANEGNVIYVEGMQEANWTEAVELALAADDALLLEMKHKSYELGVSLRDSARSIDYVQTFSRLLEFEGK